MWLRAISCQRLLWSASLVILLSRAGVPQIFKILGPEARVVATKALGIRAMVVIMVVVDGQDCSRANAMDAHE